MAEQEKQPEVRIICQECGEPMVIRENRATGEKFLGCSHYPECTFTRPLTEYLRLKLAGAPTLF